MSSPSMTLTASASRVRWRPLWVSSPSGTNPGTASPNCGSLHRPGRLAPPDRGFAVRTGCPAGETGDSYLRRLLVGSAQYILGPFGPDRDLSRWGLKLAERGGKNAKRRAIVAVARKLAILLHHLWTNGVIYDPLYQEKVPIGVPATVAA